MTGEERDQWERDEEALRHDDAQTGHAPALPATESDETGSRVLPDPARVARYAEAIDPHVGAESEPGYNRWRCTCGEEIATGRKARAMAALRDHRAAAVVAVADEEHAALVAEVERGRGSRNALHAELRLAQARAEAAEAKVDALRPQVGRLSDLISSIEEECDTTGPVCHGHDLTEDGECALSADLLAIFHAIQGALFAKHAPPSLAGTGVIDVDMTGLNGDAL